MTTDEIIAMAKEVGFGNYAYEAASMFGRFAALVAEAEREACALVCESEWATDAERAFGGELAALIRARGTP